MQIATETERKYDVGDEFALPQLDGAGDAQTHHLEAAYFDTEDLRLAANRMTLRRRTGGTDEGWHLKTPGGGSSRTEHRLPLGEADGGVPAELLERVRAVVRRAELVPVARLRTRRVETPLRDGDGRTLALVEDDTVDAEAYGEVQRWREIEVELVDGDADVLERVEQALRAAGAHPAAGPSKLARVLGDRVPAPQPPAAGGRIAKVQEYARKQRAAIVANDPGARDADEDAVHDMRVAIRRLRSTLKTYRTVFPPDRAARLRDELKWLAERLGAVRDTQVMEGHLDKLAPGDEFAAVHERLRGGLDENLDTARRELTEALSGERYLRLLDELDAVVDAPAAAGSGRVRRRARKALGRADAMLTAADEPGPDRDHRLHEARKAYKRARYAAEVFGEPGKELVVALTELQDLLGAHQDAVITGELLRDQAGRAHAAGENGFGYGVLYARQQRVGEEALEALPAARRQAGRRRVRRFLG